MNPTETEVETCRPRLLVGCSQGPTDMFAKYHLNVHNTPTGEGEASSNPEVRGTSEWARQPQRNRQRH